MTGPTTAIENLDFMSFPDFYMVHNESGWHWVSRDGCRSSPRAFRFAPACMYHAERTLDQLRRERA